MPFWGEAATPTVVDAAVSAAIATEVTNRNTAIGVETTNRQNADGAKQNIVEGVNTVAAAGASQTLAAVTTATVNDLTLTAACTITLPTGTPGASCTLVLRQGGSGSYTVTFTPTPKYANGAAPVLSTAVGAVDILTFFYVTAWNCAVVGTAFA